MKSKKKQYGIHWYLIGIGLTLTVALMLLSNLLQVGERLGKLHPALEAVFYLSAAVLFCLLLVYPVWKVLAAPSFTLNDVINGEAGRDRKLYRRIALNLIRDGSLTAEETARLKYAIVKGSDLKKVLVDLYENSIKKDIDKIITQDAQKVMLITGISQSGRMDMLTVMGVNLKMIHRLVSRCGFRPSLPSLVRLYVNVFSTAMLAEGLEELEVEEIIPSLGESGMMKLPGLPLVFESMAQGLGNAFLTLRVGIIARNYIFSEGRELTRAAVRKSAFKEAAGLMKPMVKSLLKLVPEQLDTAKKQFVEFFG